jgi:hypothetical protein
VADALAVGGCGLGEFDLELADAPVSVGCGLGGSEVAVPLWESGDNRSLGKPARMKGKKEEKCEIKTMLKCKIPCWNFFVMCVNVCACVWCVVKCAVRLSTDD